MRKPALAANDLISDGDETRLLAQVAPQLAHLVRREVVLVRVEGHVVLQRGACVRARVSVYFQAPTLPKAYILPHLQDRERPPEKFRNTDEDGGGVGLAHLAEEELTQVEQALTELARLDQLVNQVVRERLALALIVRRDPLDDRRRPDKVLVHLRGGFDLRV